MAAIPKSIKLTGITVLTTLGTVPADKAWLIKSCLVYNVSGATDAMQLSVGGDIISGGRAFSAISTSMDLLEQTAGAKGVQNVIASEGELVRVFFKTGSGSKNARLSYVEIDV